MTWLAWLGLAVVLGVLAAVTGIKPKGTRHVAGTRLMGVARFVLLIVIGLWYVLRRHGVPAPGREVSPTIVWLVAQPLAVRILIVVSAMIVEELFFRAFLQPRVGAIAATLMFTAAHGAYGQPLVLVGILVISTVLSITFAIYRNVLPCIVAHGVFDSIQMFVIIPLALKGVG